MAGFVVAALLGVMPALATELPGIIDRDDRIAVESDAWPWSAIGRVNKAGAGFCTGTLVGPDLVATAAHCLINRRTGRLHRPEFLTFVAGYSRGEYQALGRVRRYEFPACSDDQAVDRLSSIAHDVAFLRLTEPVTDPAPIHFLEQDEAIAAGDLVLAGYQQDRPYMLSTHSGCRRVGGESSSGVLIHSCDATHGASGGPLLRHVGTEWRVVALHVGTGRSERLPAGVFGLASTWPTGVELADSLALEPGNCGPVDGSTTDHPRGSRNMVPPTH